jgi:hypothetical protein
MLERKEKNTEKKEKEKYYQRADVAKWEKEREKSGEKYRMKTEER